MELTMVVLIPEVSLFYPPMRESFMEKDKTVTASLPQLAD